MTVKTLLAVLLFAGIGTIIIGGGYIVGEYSKISNNQTNNKIWNSIYKCSEEHPEFCDRSCNIDSDCYPTCTHNMGCLRSEEGQVGASAIRCEVAPFSCKCEDNTCKIVEYEEVEEKNKCLLTPEVGPCKAIIKKYYFDYKENKCQEFIWGGCLGVVPFETMEDCKKECEKQEDVSDWQTYQDEEFGFEVKYPSNYIEKEKENYILWLDNKDTIENNKKWHEEHPSVPGPINSDFISIKNYDNKNGLSLKEWFNNTLKNELRSTVIEDYYIGNTHALKTAIPSICSNYKIFISDQENIIIEIETCAADFDDKDNYFVKFLSTFKFIEK